MERRGETAESVPEAENAVLKAINLLDAATDEANRTIKPQTTRGTSPLSLTSRMSIRQRFQKKRRTITWKKCCAVNGHIQQVSGHMLDIGCPGLALC